jgi:hypothetical protein
VEVKAFVVVFSLLSVFVFVVALPIFSLKDSSRASIRTLIGCSLPLCLMVSDGDELGLLSEGRLPRASALNAVTRIRDWIVCNNLFHLEG